MNQPMWTVGRRLLNDACIIARDCTAGGYTGECPGCQSVRRFLESHCEIRATCGSCGAVFVNARWLEGARGGGSFGPSRPCTEFVPVCDWQPTYWRSRWVRIAPCPGTARSLTWQEPWPHERIVVDDPDDPAGRSHVCCSCGYRGPLFETEEQAVAAFNREQGAEGLEPVTEWVYHPHLPVEAGGADLPF